MNHFADNCLGKKGMLYNNIYSCFFFFSFKVKDFMLDKMHIKIAVKKTTFIYSWCYISSIILSHIIVLNGQTKPCLNLVLGISSSQKDFEHPRQLLKSSLSSAISTIPVKKTMLWQHILQRTLHLLGTSQR